MEAMQVNYIAYSNYYTQIKENMAKGIPLTELQKKMLMFNDPTKMQQQPMMESAQSNRPDQEESKSQPHMAQRQAPMVEGKITKLPPIPPNLQRPVQQSVEVGDVRQAP